MEAEEELLEDGVFDSNIHAPLTLVRIERDRRAEIDAFTLREDPQRMHPVNRRRQRKLWIWLAVRLVDCSLLDNAVVEHDDRSVVLRMESERDRIARSTHLNSTSR